MSDTNLNLLNITSDSSAALDDIKLDKLKVEVDVRTSHTTEWGYITGNINGQSDLRQALANKVSIIQGQENYGKVLGVNSSGNVITTSTVNGTFNVNGDLHVTTRIY